MTSTSDNGIITIVGSVDGGRKVKKLYLEPLIEFVEYEISEDLLTPSNPETSVPDIVTSDSLDDDW